MKEMSERVKFLFMVPVWGKHHRTLFTDVCLPMLMTPGNLGHFSGRKDVRFCIITTYTDYLCVAESAAGQQLFATIPVSFVLIDGLVGLAPPHKAMSDCYKMAMGSEYVSPGYTNYVFLSPDSFWSDGSFRHGEKLIDQGTKAIMVCGLRTDMRIADTLRKAIAEENGQTALATRDLVSLSLRNLHPMAQAHNWFSDRFLNSWPSNIYWKVNDDLMFAHCFHLHPLVVRSPKKKKNFSSTVDDNLIAAFGYSEKETHIISDSDHMFGVEISPSDRNWGQPVGLPDCRQVLLFGHLYADRTHWYNFSQRLVFRGDDAGVAGNSLVWIASNIDDVTKYILKRKPRMFMLRRVFMRTYRIISQMFRYILRVFRYIRRLLFVALRLSVSTITSLDKISRERREKNQGVVE